VIAKIDLTVQDALAHLAGRTVTDGPHPSKVRLLPRGPAVVIAPFNFPLHLGHGANVAHLLAGNPVIFKPSPLAAGVAARYAELMAAALPRGVFTLVQGGAEEALALARDSRIRAVCFTGSVPAGRALARELAADFSKELALELGGRNAAIVCADADIELAAEAVADGLCLTCGQRCNATSRVLVDERIAPHFEDRLLASLRRYQPGDPLLATTTLGPLISHAAVERYSKIISSPAGWILPGSAPGAAGGKRGHYVTPAVRRGIADAETEPFSPVLEMESFSDLDDAVTRANATPFGLTASVFTRDESLFARLADEIEAGNIYANLPTTFSPGTLPFGGFGQSGNGRPGGRGFIRFTTREQALQWREWR
jgi:acyl-CoA reductase-like NAD-dependent aldehyde dehydrogenase